MLLLRQLSPLLRVSAERFYSKRLTKKRMASLLENRSAKQVHQQMKRIIHPFGRINVCSDIKLQVQCADVHDYPDANVLIAELHGGQVNNSTATMEVRVSENAQQVDITIKKLVSNSDFHCQLAVPVRADLHIEAKDNVSVQNIFSSEIKVLAHKNIETKELRADNLQLHSAGGDIKCEGMLLGRETSVETKLAGSISLDKLQGDNLSCKADAGSISTNSCYVESSQFETNCGNLELKNVHKTVSAYVHKNGDINMYGVHGKLFISSNGGKLNLQLSEITAESTITVNEVENATINISDSIEQQTSIEITSTTIVLDGTLSHLANFICGDKKIFRMLRTPDTQSKLIVRSNRDVTLGKLSWMEMLRAKMNITADGNKLE